MIPKIIHYCWFGKQPFPDKVLYCISSWKKFLPDYEIKEWNEDNFDINNSCAFVKEAYKNKKWAFVADYVRFFVLNKEGGIYLDTDVEVIKNFDTIINEQNLIIGKDNGGFLSGAIMASKPNQPFLCKILLHYDSIHFEIKGKKLNQEVVNTQMQNLLKHEGYVCENKFQKLPNEIYLYPDDYFEAYNLTNNKTHITKNTYCIHHHTLLWISNKSKIIKWLRFNIFVPIIGAKLYTKLTGKIKRTI